MTAPLFPREIARDIAARKILSDGLVEIGEPGAGLLEGLGSLRERYRLALVRRNAALFPDDGDAEP